MSESIAIGSSSASSQSKDQTPHHDDNEKPATCKGSGSDDQQKESSSEAATSGTAKESNSGSSKEDGSGSNNKEDKPVIERSNSEIRRIAAAQMIQSNYRGYKTRRELKGMSLDSDSRWNETLKSMKLNQARQQQFPGAKGEHKKNRKSKQKGEGAEEQHEAEDGQGQGGDDNNSHAASRWKRGGLLVGQIAGSPCAGGGSGGKESAGGEGSLTDGPVEGGPSFTDSEGEEGEEKSKKANKEDGLPAGGQPKKESSNGKVGDVPGAYDNGKIDNVKSIAKPHQRTLRMIEWWTRGAEVDEIGKTMEAIYWLEMVDRKHRYGSNLKHYHAIWSESDTKQNFFYWLDEGEGKDLDLDDTPRERLEKERIDYLSADQRRNYVVDIKDGKLYWRHNGKALDTTKGKWKDMGHGRGIAEIGPEEQEENRKYREEQKRQAGSSASSSRSSLSDSASISSSSSSSSDDDSDDSSLAAQEATHYGADQSSSKKHFGILNSKNWSNALLRKTLKANIWIYVLNSRRELYVGIKQTGKFQHSSFLYGGRVISAGLLKCSNGTLTSLSPLSGHYRAGTAHFRQFVYLLQQQGVDLSHVTLSKSLLLLKLMETHKKHKAKQSQKKKEKEKSKEKDDMGLPLLRKLKSDDSEGKKQKEDKKDDSQTKPTSSEKPESSEKETSPSGASGAPNTSQHDAKQEDPSHQSLSSKLKSALHLNHNSSDESNPTSSSAKPDQATSSSTLEKQISATKTTTPAATSTASAGAAPTTPTAAAA